MTMPKQQPATSKQDYATPRDFVRAVQLKLKIDHFDFDFAADADNTVAPHFWTAADDALVKTPQQWRAELGADGWGWLNPPFRHIAPWARRCAETAQLGGAVALLVPASVGANWFRESVEGHADVWFVNGRLAFMPDKPRWLYPKDCLVALYYGSKQTEYEVWNWRKELQEAQCAFSY